MRGARVDGLLQSVMNFASCLQELPLSQLWQGFRKHILGPSLGRDELPQKRGCTQRAVYAHGSRNNTVILVMHFRVRLAVI